MILLTLSRGKGEETVRLQLPASPAEIGETFAFLDRISLDTTATAILDVSSNVPVLYRCLYDVDVEDSEQFQKLQKLAERTEALSPAKAAIFSGALDAECVWNLEGALTVADRLDEYIIKQGDDRLYSFKIEPTTGGSFFRMLTEDLRLNTRLLDTFLPLIKAHYLDFIDRFEVDPAEALQPVCAPFIQPGDYSWCIHVREQMVERYGTAEQLEEYRRQAELLGTPEHKAKNWMGSMLFHLSHANDVDHAWASSLTKEELDQVVEPFVQAKRQTGQWTQEDEAGYQLYQQETDPKKRTFRVWYLIANPRGLPKEFVQKELEFRWKLFPEKKEETK